MRKTLRASVLVLALCSPALAGDIPNPLADGDIPNPTAPQPVVEFEEADADGGTQNGAADSLTGTVLDLLAGVLALV